PTRAGPASDPTVAPSEVVTVGH
ncbi:MAG: hypothetical protein QOF01_3297, partial [Thermomicrobiales bacterium]|nr:hypothetical protein [Thermomicrobiales bacterium]